MTRMGVSDAGMYKALGGGGLALFAMLVLYLMREQTPVLKAIRAGLLELRDELFEMRITDSARLERDRRREARAKRDSEQPPARRNPMPSIAPPPKGEFDAEDKTDIQYLIEIEREKAVASRGKRKPRPGTHHDEDR